MAIPQPPSSNASDLITESRYPAMTQQSAGPVDGIHTDVMCVSFSDKLLITITQEGRLAQWVHVQLEASTPTLAGLQQLDSSNNLVEDNDDVGLLPMAHLTATTLLGGTVPERQIVGQLLATQIASAVAMKNPQESRMLLLGLGLKSADSAGRRDAYFEIVDLVLKCL
ncbi:MAG: hypothetical protein M1816_001197 [Peltula sp. TS41687]|nr:MAG: hypothetical protein M1816_001197 [Peltula sp. TS41687]